MNQWREVFGPFRPGTADEPAREIVVPTIEPSLEQVLRDMFTSSNAPAATEPGQDADDGSVEARIVDARSGKPIAHASLKLEKSHGRVSYSSRSRSNLDGRARDTRVASGHWKAHVEAEHYDSSPDRWIEVRHGAQLDLGTIALEPAIDTSITLLESDGSPVPRDTEVAILDENAHSTIAELAQVDTDEGHATIGGRLPARFQVEVRETGDDEHDGEYPARQRVVVDRRGEDPVIVHLAPWQRVEIRIVGPVAEPPFTSLNVSLKTDSLQDSSLPSLSVTGQELAASSQAVRRFVARVPADRYRVRGDSPFHIEETSIEVKDVTGTQVFELSSMP